MGTFGKAIKTSLGVLASLVEEHKFQSSLLPAAASVLMEPWQEAGQCSPTWILVIHRGGSA